MLEESTLVILTWRVTKKSITWGSDLVNEYLLSTYGFSDAVLDTVGKTVKQTRSLPSNSLNLDHIIWKIFIYIYIYINREREREFLSDTWYSCLLVFSCSVVSNLLWPHGLPGSSVQGISKARILVWVAISFSRGSSRPRDRTFISCIAGGLFTTEPLGKLDTWYKGN